MQAFSVGQLRTARHGVSASAAATSALRSRRNCAPPRHGLDRESASQRRRPAAQSSQLHYKFARVCPAGTVCVQCKLMNARIATQRMGEQPCVEEALHPRPQTGRRLHVAREQGLLSREIASHHALGHACHSLRFGACRSSIYLWAPHIGSQAGSGHGAGHW